MADQNATQALPVILERLHAAHPNARYELDFETPLQLLVATILAAQCTDERVNQVTPALFARYPTARAYAEADVGALAEDIRSISFNRQKARAIQGVARVLVERHGGEVPAGMGEMVALPGVARKTANVVLNNAFGLPTGVIVDTHVARVSRRLGLTAQARPEKIEGDLMGLVPREEWVFFGPALVLLGRYTCKSHAPNCAGCVMGDLCPKVGVGGDREEEVPATMSAKRSTPARAGKNGKAVTRGRAASARPAGRPGAATVAAPALREQLPADWRAALGAELDKPYFRSLEAFIAQERARGEVYPPAEDVFAAFRATGLGDVKVVLLGQDPYHGAGEAHGMAFSVRPGVKVPPSLANVYRELHDDLGCAVPGHGHLAAWARQGVLLLNTVLTVRANEAGSHKERGWETFTDAVLTVLNGRERPLVFLLWGAAAQKKAGLIDAGKHRALVAGHPSPLSAKKFFGSRPFSATNAALRELGQAPIDWQVPDEGAPSAPAPEMAVQAVAVAQADGPTRLETFLPGDWREALADDLRKPSFRNLDRFLAGERRDTLVCPVDEADVFGALRLTPLRAVRVVLLGAEPPCFESVADGLAYSAREGGDLSDVQRALFGELRRDLGLRMPITSSLEPWARQGVLLLNAVLTVRSGRPGSHRDKGWEAFTDAVLRRVSAGPGPVVFALWGHAAVKKRSLIDEGRHVVVVADHPATAPGSFAGSGVFSEINTALELNGRSAVYWQLPYV